MSSFFQMPAFPGEPQYQYEVTLDGEVFRFNVFYNNRDDSMYFDLADTSGTVVRRGVRVTGDIDLLRQISTGVRPEGQLFAALVTANIDPPDFNEFGDDALFIYLGDS